jgi:hypothetical protein
MFSSIQIFTQVLAFPPGSRIIQNICSSWNRHSNNVCDEYNTRYYPESLGFLDFVHRPVFYKAGNATCRKMDPFPSSGEGGVEDTDQLGPSITRPGWLILRDPTE